MLPRGPAARTYAWRAFGIVCAIVLYVISISGRAYNATSPTTLPYHEIFRKTYAVGAFAVLGFALERSRLRWANGVIAGGIAIGLYSWAIEIGQIVHAHSTETFAEHSFDVASGIAGGALGAFVALLITAPRARARRLEAIGIAIAFALLLWGFTETYAGLD